MTVFSITAENSGWESIA